MLLTLPSEAFDRFCYALLMTGQISLYVRLMDQSNVKRWRSGKYFSSYICCRMEAYSNEAPLLEDNAEDVENEVRAEEAFVHSDLKSE